MNKNIFLTSLFLLLNCCIQAQNDTISQRIVLIGDAGLLTDGKHPVVDAVRNLIPLDKKTTILYLGDNIYPKGLPNGESSTFGKYKAILDSQLAVAAYKDAKVYMIPGNHDWSNGGIGGYQAILRQQLYVEFYLDSLGKSNVNFVPADGCPGPVEIKLGNDVVIIAYDSQWWLHPYEKPGIESDCTCKTNEELAEKIEQIAARNSKKLVILASHHPFKSYGAHGGYFTLTQHLFPFTDLFPSAYIPLPVLGSVYPLVRSVFGTPQDLKHPVYADMIEMITSKIKNAAPNVVFVSGHEHNLQYIKDEDYHYIVSGGGCKTQRVISSSRKGQFTSPNHGFSVLEVSTNKNVTVTFYTVTDSVRKEYTSGLLNFSKIPDRFLIDSSAFLGDDPFLKYKDTITTQASQNFSEVQGLKKLFMGQNYRKEWATPVNMKIFNLKREKGGFSIDPEGLGGGKQTKTLTLTDKNGKKWVLRTVDKKESPAVPEEFNDALPDVIMNDFNSSAHPYAALVIPSLAKPLDIPVANPELFFVPDDPAFGFFRPVFAGKVCMLEEKDPSPDSMEIRSTAKIFSKMLYENDHRVDQPAVLKARLLDMLIGDFERHFDQWKWIVNDTGKGKYYHPIPKDRDQAFFNSDGLQMKLVGGRVIPFLKGFKKDFPDINWLGYPAKDFDRIFLTSLDAEEWKAAIVNLREKITDDVIRYAVMQLPPEVFSINGEKIIQKLISRRDLLAEKAMEYYYFISKKVNVIGSNNKEYFKVSSTNDGLRIKVWARERDNDTSFLMFDRVFDPDVTKEIRLLGLNDNDLFEVDSTASSRIKLRIIGGQGEDTFDIRGNVENLLYDLKGENAGNFIKNSSQSKNRFSLDPPVNENTITKFEYNRRSFPDFSLNYNSDDGLFAGIGFSKTTQGFRNLPYATYQKFSALYSTRGAHQLIYKGEFNHITRNIDLLVQANYISPAIRNFFGLGNKTKVDQAKNYDFYRSRYQTFEAGVMIRKRYFEKLNVQAGPYFYQYSNSFKNNTGNVLSKPRQVGLDSADIFSQKSYMGGKFSFHFDNRNNTLFPSRGIRWENELTGLAGLKKGSDNFTSFTTDMSIFISQGNPAKIIAVLGMGYGKIFSKNFEFFQAMDIGAKNNLHGFRKNRYTGSSNAYASLEFRIKLFDVNSYLMPGPFGLTVFSDIGRVWLKGEQSRKWHTAFGGGFYFIPFNQFIISASAGISGKDKLLNFNLGTRIGLTF